MLHHKNGKENPPNNKDFVSLAGPPKSLEKKRREERSKKGMPLKGKKAGKSKKARKRRSGIVGEKTLKGFKNTSEQNYDLKSLRGQRSHRGRNPENFQVMKKQPKSDTPRWAPKQGKSNSKLARKVTNRGNIYFSVTFGIIFLALGLTPRVTFSLL